MTVDMGVPADCQAAWQRILADMGPIDIVINNVGNREVSVPIASESLETWQQSIDLNLTSCFLGTRLAGEACWRREGPHHQHRVDQRVDCEPRHRGRDYETGKAAVLHFTRRAAADWALHGVTVNAICPGLFMTDINRQWERRPDVIAAFVQNVPMGRPGEPDEIGPLAVFLASDASSYVTGAAYLIDGGYTLW
jgi:gluconate 5-dehydrogenase